MFGFLFLVDLVLKKSKSKQLLYVLPYFFFLFPHFFEIWEFFVYGDFCASLFANVGFHNFLYVYVFLCIFFKYWHMSQFLMKFDEI